MTDRPRVLVVEDNPSVLALMATILEDCYQITTASSCASALSLVGRTSFEVVLTDVRMPDGSGFDVLRSVQAARAPRAAVLMLTAYANVPDAVAAIKAGAYDYVAKPLDADEILLVVARAAEHQRESAHPPAARLGLDPSGASDPGDEVLDGFRCAVEKARARASREYLVRLLRDFDGNVTHAARRAGMTRESLHRVMRKYGVHAGHGAGEQGVGQPAPRSTRVG